MLTDGANAPSAAMQKAPDREPQDGLRILLVEDNPGDADLIRVFLRQSGTRSQEAEQVDQLHDAIERLKRGGIDIVVLDLGLPDSEGVESVEAVCSAAPDAPVVVLTGTDDETLGLAAVRAGAQDYLVKGHVDGATLRRVLRYASERKAAQKDLRRSEEATRLLNRRLETLRSAVAELAAVRTLEEVVAVVRVAARQLTESDGALFAVREGNRCSYADADTVAPSWREDPIALEASICGWVIRNCQAAAIEDIRADGRIPANARDAAAYARSLAIAPIRGSETLGAVAVWWTASHGPTQNEMDLLQALADGAAVAMENVESYHLLEQRVRERTSELEAANRELDAFAHSVSHDLRAPLRAIDGYSQMLFEDLASTLAPDDRKMLEELRGSVHDMQQLIDDLLAFARMGRQELTHLPLDLLSLAREVANELRRAHPNRSIEFNLPERMPVASGDAAMMREVLRNLLGNAVKYTARCSVARIGLACEEKERELIYAVSDNGVGFDMKYVDKLFRVFQRLHSAQEFEGTGIGLAIVDRIIQRHGGRVWAHARQDEGATFCFALPIRRE